MKKYILLIVAVMMACMPLTAGRLVETRGDTLLIARDGDTVRLNGTQTIKELVGMLDDTIVNLNDESSQAAIEEGEVVSPGARQLAVDSQKIWASTLEQCTIVGVWGLVCLIFVILLFNYLKRRRKYKMVEKAIENNYPLPPYVFDSHAAAPSSYYTPTPPVQGSPILEGAPVASGEPVVDENGEVVPPPLGAQADPWSAAQAQPVVGEPRMNWRSFQGSFVLVAVGLGLMIMFHETPLVGIFAILVLIGLGKGFLIYQDQRDAINAWRKK